MNQADQREEAVFEAALQLPVGERAGYLDKTCARDADLRFEAIHASCRRMDRRV